MTRIEFTREAQKDLSAIRVWLAQRNPAAARRVMQFITLSETPRMGQSRPDLMPGLMGLVVSPYLVLYRLSDETVTVVRVVDGRRDLHPLFNPTG